MVEQVVPMAWDAAAGTLCLEERLERGEIAYYERCPFAVPEGDERRFLLAQHQAARSKNISYNPATGTAQGFQRRSADDAERLRQLLAAFSCSVTVWLADALPDYASAWKLDRASFRPEEEATRRLRPRARNDLVHVDAFPTRPTNGQRILRCFVNLNPTEPRIWVTSEPFEQLVQRFGRELGLAPGGNLRWTWKAREQLLRLLQPSRPRRSAYDEFMLRFHDFLKMNERFQDQCPKRCWAFAPGSAWVVFSDAVSHAALRGQFALEHSYFVPCTALRHPDWSPLAILQRMCGTSLRNAA